MNKSLRTGIIILISLFLLLLIPGLGLIQQVHADNTGGGPTRTPTRSPTPTSTMTLAPIIIPPTLTPLPGATVTDSSLGGLTVATAKALPTGTLLSLEDISATLAVPAAQTSAPSSLFWIYVFILFVVAAAVVVAVIIGLMRQRNQPLQPPPEEPLDTPPPP